MNHQRQTKSINDDLLVVSHPTSNTGMSCQFGSDGFIVISSSSSSCCSSASSSSAIDDDGLSEVYLRSVPTKAMMRSSWTLSASDISCKSTRDAIYFSSEFRQGNVPVRQADSFVETMVSSEKLSSTPYEVESGNVSKEMIEQELDTSLFGDQQKSNVDLDQLLRELQKGHEQVEKDIQATHDRLVAKSIQKTKSLREGSRQTKGIPRKEFQSRDQFSSSTAAKGDDETTPIDQDLKEEEMQVSSGRPGGAEDQEDLLSGQKVGDDYFYQIIQEQEATIRHLKIHAIHHLVKFVHQEKATLKLEDDTKRVTKAPRKTNSRCLRHETQIRQFTLDLAQMTNNLSVKNSTIVDLKMQLMEYRASSTINESPTFDSDCDLGDIGVSSMV